MKRRQSKGVFAFLTMLMACAAFLVGSVKIWGVPAEKLWSGLLVILIMVVALALLAFLLVFVIHKIKKITGK
ncbi:MAG: hypothetical protein M0Q95_02075 [Porticoccaceae bacterium]|nr:hypothetical protein [Porticoccaceae bacterium]